MPSPIESIRPTKLTAETFALCLLLSSCLQIAENLLPRIPIFPWLRFGFTYLILLPFLFRFGAGRSCLLFLCRNAVALVYGGQIFSSFLISTLSGIVSIGAIGSCVCFLSKRRMLGIWGASLLLAASFNSMQLLVADRLFVRHLEFYFQLAPLLIWSLISGSIIAFLVHKNQKGFDLICDSGRGILFTEVAICRKSPSRWDIGLLLVAVTCFTALFFLSAALHQLAVLTCILLVTRRRNLRAVYYAWPFYLYIAFFHLLRTDGVYLYRDWITLEGWNAFLFYALRTTNVILCGQWISRHIPAIRVRSVSSPYVRGMSFALPLLPSLFGVGISIGKSLFKRIRAREFDSLLPFAIERLERELTIISRQNRIPQADL